MVHLLIDKITVYNDHVDMDIKYGGLKSIEKDFTEKWKLKNWIMVHYELPFPFHLLLKAGESEFTQKTMSIYKIVILH